MADITKCDGINCPQKDMCYRFLAKSDNYQSWFIETPIKNGQCDQFWKYTESTSN